ncbi:hypothetical protein LEP1GSC058_0692 [Leptospira fainei serovar Hurstbridge str. BUT 6]|uniref:Uncharacterized protein n=1 Tax=Leptospira fainei serovar Hurstbridge str. BUT 6 TaxID=1193011 RepID=S3VH70_9LEPT|nr:hypothetical protein [Leptospira fainei]EPG75835.1 hypothetical protein LEP1GSC058_0692 [Leptospira fainei serovar Hurstbridge str. BUT 6]
MNLQIAFLAFFAFLGLVVSAVCGFMAGNYISHILFITFLSTVGMGVFGFGVYTILEMKVPEFLELLRNFGGSYVSAEDGEAREGGSAGFYGERIDSDMSGVNFDSPSSPDEIRTTVAGIPRKKADKFGDHIMVENIAIKNEPKLMAEAIRTMLAKDDGSSEK